MHEGCFEFNLQSTDIAAFVSRLPASIKNAFVLIGNTDLNFCARFPNQTRHLNVFRISELCYELSQRKINIIFSSTDHVYEGNKQFSREIDPANPTTQYGKQKFAVENFLTSVHGVKILIVRLGKMLSVASFDNGLIWPWIKSLSNDEEIMIIEEQQFTPIFADDVAKILLHLVKNDLVGCYNVGGESAETRLSIIDSLINSSEFLRNYDRKKIKIIRMSEVFLEDRPKDVTLSIERLKDVYPYQLISLSQAFSLLAKQSNF